MPAPDPVGPDDPARVEWVVLGRVAGSHGLKGMLRVRYFGDGPDSLLRFPEVWLAKEPGVGARCYPLRGGGTGRSGEVRIELEGVTDRESAQSLRGLLVLGDARHLESLPDGEFYWHQLVGCRVESEDGELIGEVVEIWETGAHDLLVVRGEDGRQHLIPTAREIAKQVDLRGRRIIVEVLPGLLSPEDGSGV